MATIHIQKRTVVSRMERDSSEPVNSQVKTYTLTPEELDYYRRLPLSAADKAFKPGLKVMAMERRDGDGDGSRKPDPAAGSLVGGTEGNAHAGEAGGA
ncbi:hypothetical protein [Paenibacillus sp. UNC499MF]|uniref:hypothetical protein n=1 Tax=Paenibacillus sp. UNC499MF TaxID=1502751 RepID=UPI000CDEFDF9|nr:hypothetical protein [Paenibacillus sp. UNC499MF]